MIRGDAPDPAVRASALAPAFDMLAACAGSPDGSRFLFEREGIGVAASSMVGGIGWGSERSSQRALIDMGRSAQSRMRELTSRMDGPGPAAVGQVAFSEHGAAWMRIPAQLVRRTDRAEPWFIEVLAPDDEAAGDEAAAGEAPAFRPVRPAPGAPADPFTPAQVDAEPSPSAYEAMVSAALERIRTGPLRKVVLARTMRVRAGRALDPVKLAHRLRAVDPQAFTFIAAEAAMPQHAGHTAPTLVGASPELLVCKRGVVVRSTPLAGSAPRSGDPDEDRANAEALLASTKNREEHAIVVEAIEEALAPFCRRLDHDVEPILLETANVWHLATRFEGVLGDPAPTVVELVAALHPTPAVGGTPTELATAAIGDLETVGRGGYAGPVGWMDANGDGGWAIALRCARLEGDIATLYAGAGIVAGSRPADELEETERKFRAFLDSLRWG